MLDRLFKGFVQGPTNNSPSSGMQQGLVIPHPEEARNPSATVANTNVMAVITKWLQYWGVPAPYWDYWKTAIDIQVYDVYPDSLTATGLRQDTPAATWEAGGKRHLVIKAPWLNPGVIAHEQAHNSYALLNPNQKTAFASIYNSLKNIDPLIKLLYSINTYGLSTDIEGHAEVYRYIGQQMPAQIKQYYPKLFDSAPIGGVSTVSSQQVGQVGSVQPVGSIGSKPQTSGKSAKIIPEPVAGTRTVIDQKTLPVAVSSCNLNYLCGSCGVVLIQGMVGDQFNNIVIRCPKCGKFNEI